MDTFYGPIGIHIKKAGLYHMFMNTSEQPCWSNFSIYDYNYVSTYPLGSPRKITPLASILQDFYKYNFTSVATVFRLQDQHFRRFNLSSRSLIPPFSITFVTIIEGSLVYHYHTLCIVLHYLDISSVSGVCVFISFSLFLQVFFSVHFLFLYLSLIWFDYVQLSFGLISYQKPLYQKTEN